MIIFPKSLDLLIRVGQRQKIVYYVQLSRNTDTVTGKLVQKMYMDEVTFNAAIDGYGILNINLHL
jgi:hypothetical protein